MKSTLSILASVAALSLVASESFAQIVPPLDGGQCIEGDRVSLSKNKICTCVGQVPLAPGFGIWQCKVTEFTSQGYPKVTPQQNEEHEALLRRFRDRHPGQ